MSEAAGFAIPLDETLDGVLGIETLELTRETARARVRVDKSHKQPYGIVHGGTYATVAESLASQATARAVYEDGNIAVGMSNFTTYVRPITDGHVNASARRVHGGRTTWVWDIEMTDDEGRLCASSRLTIAVRPAPQR